MCYHQCDHDGKSIGNLLSGLYQDDGQTDGHPHHTSHKGSSSNDGIGSRIHLDHKCTQATRAELPSIMHRDMNGEGIRSAFNVL